MAKQIISTELVINAQKGDSDAISKLYEMTVRDEYYIALKYMKNKEDAEDVIQDAFMKAFSNLDKLKDPSAFSSWLGMIVANTAKNALVKKRPMSFSDLVTEDETEGEEPLLRIEDLNTNSRPEEVYLESERKELIDVLLDSLTDEQRMSVMMFYMEELSIKEIADTLGTNENTVKSRLFKARKNLNAKAEEMKKKGYVFCVAPLPLLVMLLNNEKRVFAAEAAAQAAESAVQGTQAAKETTQTAAKAAAQKTAQTAAKAAVKGTVGTGAKAAAGAGISKGVLAIVIAAVAVGGVFGGYAVSRHIAKSEQTQAVAEEADQNAGSKAEYLPETEEQEEEEPAIELQPVILKGVSGNNEVLRAAWEESAEEIDGYEVQYSFFEEFNDDLIEEVSGKDHTDVTIENVSLGQTYYVRVRTYKDIEGERASSTWSNVVSDVIVSTDEMRFGKDQWFSYNGGRVIFAEGADLMSEPSEESALVRHLAFKDNFEWTEQDTDGIGKDGFMHNWGYIRCDDGTEGWIRREYVAPNFHGFVVLQNTRLRAKPDDSSETLSIYNGNGVYGLKAIYDPAQETEYGQTPVWRYIVTETGERGWVKESECAYG